MSESGWQSHDNSNSTHARAPKSGSRFSSVCRPCKRAKTKCDREKPACGRCVRQLLNCTYDVVKHLAPKILSKDATIVRLQKELEFWKKHYESLQAPSHNFSTNQSPEYSSLAFDNKDTDVEGSRKKQKIEEISRESSQLMVINLYKDNPTMLGSRIFKREVKPLSEIYMIMQDKYVSMLIASIFLDNDKMSLIPALAANANIAKSKPRIIENIERLEATLLLKCQSDAQKKQVSEFVNRILQNCNAFRILKMGMLLSMLYNSVGLQLLEDHSVSENDYSEVLSSLIAEMESILPPFHIIQKYKSHFFSYVYPCMAFLEPSLFDESISSTIFPHPTRPDKIQIKLGKSEIRKKMENICLLLIILRITHLTMTYLDGNVDVPEINGGDDVNFKAEYPITNDYILLAQRILASENCCVCVNENVIACLLFIWTFFTFSPDEGDMFLEHPTDVLSSSILMLATSIGLHRDPKYFPQFQKPNLIEGRLLNYRRRLWIGVVIVTSFESCLKGRFSVAPNTIMSSFLDIDDPDFINIYTERYNEDMIEPTFSHEFELHRVNLGRLKLGILMAKLDCMTLSYSKGFALTDFETLRSSVRSLCKHDLHIIPLQGAYFGCNNKSTIGHQKSNSYNELPARHTIFAAHNNSAVLASRIFGDLVLLRSSMAVFLNFERLTVDHPKTYLPYYRRYFLSGCLDSLKLASCYSQFYEKDLKELLHPLNSFYVTKILQLALSSSLFSLLSFLMRTDFCIHDLFTELKVATEHNNPIVIQTINERVECFTMLQRILEKELVDLYRIASKHLRFLFFSVFKLLALFDVIMQRFKKGELISGIFKLVNVSRTNPKYVKALKINIGVYLDKNPEILSDMKASNSLSKVSTEELKRITNKLQEFRTNGYSYDYLEDMIFDKDCEENRTDYSTQNQQLQSLDKLSSAAAFSHNLDLQFQYNTVPHSFDDIVQEMNAKQPATSKIEETFDLHAQAENSSLDPDELFSPINNLWGGETQGLFSRFDLFDYDFLFTDKTT